MAVESELPPPTCWGALFEGEIGRETREGDLNEGVAVLSGLVIMLEMMIESLTPGGLVEGRVLSGDTNSSSWGMISS